MANVQSSPDGTSQTSLRLVAIVAVMAACLGGGVGLSALQRQSLAPMGWAESPQASAEAPISEAPPTDVAEVERLRRERDVAAAQAAREPSARPAAAAGQARASERSAVGSWRGYVTPWSDGEHTWTLYADGTFAVNGVVAGHWSQSGSRVTWRYSDYPHAEYVGTISGNTLAGNASAEGSPDATFRLTRQ